MTQTTNPKVGVLGDSYFSTRGDGPDYVTPTCPHCGIKNDYDARLSAKTNKVTVSCSACGTFIRRY